MTLPIFQTVEKDSKFDPWETEAMHAYQTIKLNNVNRTNRANTGVLFHRYNASTTPCEHSNEEEIHQEPEEREFESSEFGDWIVIDPVEQKTEIHENLKPDVKVPKKQRRKSTQSKKHKSELSKPGQVYLTRTLTNTAYHRIYKKPIAHAFGNGNIRPVSEENMLRTFNVKAAETNPSSVYPSSLRASGQNAKRNETGKSLSANIVQRKLSAVSNIDAPIEDESNMTNSSLSTAETMDLRYDQDELEEPVAVKHNVGSSLCWAEDSGGGETSFVNGVTKNEPRSPYRIEPSVAAGRKTVRSEPVAALLVWS